MLTSQKVSIHNLGPLPAKPSKEAQLRAAEEELRFHVGRLFLDDRTTDSISALSFEIYQAVKCNRAFRRRDQNFIFKTCVFSACIESGISGRDLDDVAESLGANRKILEMSHRQVKALQKRLEMPDPLPLLHDYAGRVGVSPQAEGRAKQILDTVTSHSFLFLRKDPVKVVLAALHIAEEDTTGKNPGMKRYHEAIHDMDNHASIHNIGKLLRKISPQ